MNDNEKPLTKLLDQDEAGAEDILAVLRLIAERAGKVILGYYVEAEASGWSIRWTAPGSSSAATASSP